jgi:hypothetical protein
VPAQLAQRAPAADRLAVADHLAGGARQQAEQRAG